MSSPVHTAPCVRREGRLVDIDIGPTTATGIHFPVSPTFALGLLHESAAGDVFSAPGRLWPRKAEPPLARVITFDEMIQLSSAEGELKDGEARAARDAAHRGHRGAVVRPPRAVDDVGRLL